MAAAVVALDQTTKAWALRHLADGPVEVVWTLRLRLTFNAGTAFGLAGGAGPVIAVIAVAAAAGALWWARRVPAWQAAVAGLIAGGALGNVIDRVVRATDGPLSGHVVDFIDLGWWPVFNLADMAIVSGAVVLGLFHRPPPPPPGGRHRGP